jgi:hypothetical protein
MKVTAISLFVIMLFLIPLSSSSQSCGDFPARGFEGSQMRRFTGQYSNPNYGFAVIIPEGLTGYDSPAPNPHHGFGVVLSWEPRSYIYFDGSYTMENSSLHPMSLDEVEESNLGWLREESEQVRSIRQARMKLGSLQAKRHVVYRTCKGHNEVFVADGIFALSNSGEITYSAILLTTQSRYEKDRDLFESFLRTWRLSRIK